MPNPFQALLATALLATASAEVRVRDEGRTYLLENDRISARIDKSRATVVSLSRDGQELIRGGTGYWSLSGGSENGRAQGFPRPATTEISIAGGKLGEVVLNCPYQGAAGTLPVNASFHYTLLDGAEGLHIRGRFEHAPGMPGFSVGEARFVVKPDPRVFDWLTIDADRSRKMPTGDDWDNASPLNLKEARRLTTGIHKGQPEHKYGYSALFSESPAYGWSSSEKQIGLWMVNPSLEYIAGGPTKPELTGHLDVNPGGRPVLLNMWHGSHYGGSSLAVKTDEAWAKVIGPFLLHTNQGGDALELWNKAMKTAAAENLKWPYAWVEDPLYAAGSRLPVTGRITVKDLPGSPSPGTLWIGLTSPDYESRSRRGGETVGWQRDGKHYQYWAKAGADGRFRLGSVRPGTYVLRAFAKGVLGEFQRSEIVVSRGHPLDLGKVEWQPARSGPTVWEIGVPDRDSREFRNGGYYWQWGQYFKYQKEFPDGVDFTVGSSDWRKDWNFCQPLRLDDKGRVLGDSIWKLRFNLEEPADHVLRIALCGHREGDRLHVSINGNNLGDSGRLRENGVMHRDGHRGLLTELGFPIPAGDLQEGENVLELRLSGRVWHQGLLYDYLRLERVDNSRAQADRS
ncbi:polysaccharide lyase family protein [Luteolibacter marinus]|uniref:polysaccharide lyase family protein n=1 Tax=Luteolibacter marinus TaxID=2776705 RepID=UPI001865D798|nr:polysaccharide lyase family protein [Luteolibacter marinus]